MDVSFLCSTLSIPKYSFHRLPPFSKKGQKFPHFVLCRARTLANEVGETAINGTKNFYTILSLSPKSATTDEIKKAYRSMALRYHPDVCRDPSKKEECMRMFVQLHEAYETLSNPALREQYDYELGLVTSKRRRWDEQLIELERRSCERMAQREGYNSSWGSRMRAQIMENHN